MGQVIHFIGILFIAAAVVVVLVAFNESTPPAVGSVVIISGSLGAAFSGLLLMGFGVVIQRLTEIRNALVAANEADE